MGLTIFQVDAFTDRPFAGNPAGVSVLPEPGDERWMQNVAQEINLSETAFLCRQGDGYQLRWFTPAVEVDLCGHATLASAHCLFEDGVGAPIRFATRSGVLTVEQRPDGSLAMDFPAWPPAQIDARSPAAEALGTPVRWTGRTDNGFFLLALVPEERSVRELNPDLGEVSQLDASALIVTAVADPGQRYDFVSRLFAPNAGIPEDPLTGSSHTVLAPFWADRLGRRSLVGFQASPRSGLVGVELNGDRVSVIGRGITVLDGVLTAAATPS